MMMLFFLSASVLMWVAILKVFNLIPLSWWSIYWLVVITILIFAIVFVLREFGLIPKTKYKFDSLHEYSPYKSCPSCRKDTD